MENDIYVNRAKRYAKEWNKFRISMGESIFTKGELTRFATMERLRYANHIAKTLSDSGNIVLSGENEDGVDLYKFSGNPIHYSVVLDIVTLHIAYKKKRDERDKIENEDKNKNTKMNTPTKEEAAKTNMGVNITALLSGEGVVSAWIEYAEEITENLLLKNIMNSCRPASMQGWTFEVTVKTLLQKQTLLDNKEDILEFINKNLEHNYIDMEVLVDNIIEVDTPPLGGLWDYTDIALASELRRRGYEVIAKKIVEL